MHELKLMDVRKRYKDKDAVREDGLYIYKWGIWSAGRKWGRKDNIDAIDLRCYAANEGKDLL